MILKWLTPKKSEGDARNKNRKIKTRSGSKEKKGSVKIFLSN
jgi:hypothetical protein